MLRHKNIDRICCWVLACVLLLTCGYMGAGASGLIAADHTIGYENRLFDTSRVHTLDIVMDDWEGFLSTCTDEEYVSCHVVIDGESYKNVAIRAKGNTSLSSVQQYGNNRYSFKIEFDHYQTGNSYHGLDKLSLNNLIQDNTYLKDYFAYTLMRKGGAAAPLCSFVQINVNGEPWGLYLAVEGVEDSFLRRNYGNDTGELYKPDSMSFGGGRGNGRAFDMEDLRERFAQEDEATAGDSVEPSGTDEPVDPATQPGTWAVDEPQPGEGMTPPEGMTAPDGATLPQGMTFTEGQSQPGEGMTPPEGMTAPDGATLLQGMTFTEGQPQPGEGMTPPEGMTAPDGATLPQGMTFTEGQPQPGEGMTPPEGMTAPDGATLPQGMTFTEGQPQPGEGMTPPEGMTAPDGATAQDSLSATDDQSQSDSGATAAMDASAPTEAASEDAVEDISESPSGASATPPSLPAMPEGFDPSGRGDHGNRGGMGGGMGSSDVMLQYTNDDPDSYSNIFGNAKTDVSEADQQRLIQSLKALSEGDTSAVDTEAVIRYLAVHNFLCNDDSYTGAMVHNYYLYEKDGVLSMLPWDYNLAFGGFGMGGGFGSEGATSTVNQPIDSPVTSGELRSRPMVAWIFDSEETIAAYHAAYQQFISAAFESGWFADEIDRISNLIAPYVESDPTAFCTYEEFQTGVETLRQFCLLRAQSVQGQLDGSIPSTSEDQRNADTLIDASHLNLSDMGSMGNTMGGGGFGGDSGAASPAGGFGMGGGFGGRGQNGWMGRGQQGAASDSWTETASGQQPDRASTTAGDDQFIAATDRPDTSTVTAQPAQSADLSTATQEAASISSRPMEAQTMPFPSAQPMQSGQGWLLLAVCAAVLLAAVLLVSRYRSHL